MTSTSRLVDLSHVFGPGLSNVAGYPELDVQITQVKTLAADGVNTMSFQVADHVGTHIDAPSHIIEGGKVMAEVPLGHFYGTGVSLDMRRGDDAGIGVADLEKADPAIEDGDIVFLETGWSDRIGTREYADHHPYLDPAAASWLVAKRVAMVGIDVSSVDVPHSLRAPGFRHNTLRILLEAGIPALHGLAHLENVRNKRCVFAAFPLVFAGADAGPARVIAFVD